MIPLLDLKAATAELRSELDQAYHRFMESGCYVLGKEVEQFEDEYSNYCDARYCVGVATGLDALELALRALALKPDDEVIVPSNTYIATWLAVTRVGGKIVPVEPCAETFSLDPVATRAAITERTKVIIPVNLYGQPVDYDEFMSIAEEHNVKIVIDNAQSHGARYRGKRVGGLAHVECHSFYPSKILGASGEAGAVTTNVKEIADSVRVFRNYGSRKRYYNEVCGTNSRIDALQAAFLRIKLGHLDDWNNRRRTIAAYYLDLLSEIPELKLPSVPAWAEPVWHLFVVQTDYRDDLHACLTEHEIGTQIHYPIPPHKSQAYESLGFPAAAFPLASKISDTVLSLPMGPHLSQSDAAHVASVVSQFASRIRC